jgi:predicted  nucleic acid-binding Zn-ribbon protein
MSELERQNLEAHVDLCAERYNQLRDKLDQLDQRLGDLEQTMRQIHQELTQFRERTINRYLTWAGVIIASLCGTVGWLASRLL